MMQGDLASLEPSYTLHTIKTRSPAWPSTCAVCGKSLKAGRMRGMIEFRKAIANGVSSKTVMVCSEHLPKKRESVVATQ